MEASPITANASTPPRLARYSASCTTSPARAPRPSSATVTSLMTYMPTATAVGYPREPDMELPSPGTECARTIRNGAFEELDDRDGWCGQRLSRDSEEHLRMSGSTCLTGILWRPRVGPEPDKVILRRRPADLCVELRDSP